MEHSLSTIIRHLRLLNEDHPHPTLKQSITSLERILEKQDKIADKMDEILSADSEAKDN